MVCSVHLKILDSYAEHFISTQPDCAFHHFPCYTRSSRKVVGWNDTTNSFKKDANFWHRVWEEAGCPKAGTLFNIKRCAKRSLSMRYVVLRVGASKYHEISSLFPLLGREKTNSGQI